jgi:hypothetical protein
MPSSPCLDFADGRRWTVCPRRFAQVRRRRRRQPAGFADEWRRDVSVLEHGHFRPVHVGAGSRRPGSPDPLLPGQSALLRERRGRPSASSDFVFPAALLQPDPFEFRARDGRQRYCKFRLQPEDRGPETGIPQPDDLHTPWFQEAHPGETLSPNYLKEEFRKRVWSRGATYHLEMQLHEHQEGDHREVILSSLYEWAEATHPWAPLATVHIDSIHEADPYGARCVFEITHRPDCIRLIEPLSIYDPPSLEYLRVGGAFARRARLLGTRLFGAPQPVPDVRPPASYPDEAASSVTADDVWMDARLPQKETDARHRTRAQQLERARGLYQFTVDKRFPAYIKDLPADEEFSGDKYRRMEWDVVQIAAELGLGTIIKEFDPSKSLDAYRDFFGPGRAPLPSVVQRYASDEEFGRQRLDGINPFVIRRCDVIPDHFPVKQSTVASLLEDGPDLASLRDSGRIYLLDLAILDGVEPVPGRFLTAPMCHFQVDDKARLMPLVPRHRGSDQLARSA